MKLKVVQCFNHTQFEGKSEYYFATDAGKFKGLTMETVGDFLIRIKSDKDEIVVTWANVQYAKELNKATLAQDTKAPAKILDNPSATTTTRNK